MLMCTHNMSDDLVPENLLDNISVLDYVCTVSRASAHMCSSVLNILGHVILTCTLLHTFPV